MKETIPWMAQKESEDHSVFNIHKPNILSIYPLEADLLWIFYRQYGNFPLANYNLEELRHPVVYNVQYLMKTSLKFYVFLPKSCRLSDEIAETWKKY